jgi:hypothetical protein
LNYPIQGGIELSIRNSHLRPPNQLK